jgi:hypothetical protein
MAILRVETHLINVSTFANVPMSPSFLWPKAPVRSHPRSSCKNRECLIQVKFGEGSRGTNFFFDEDEEDDAQHVAGDAGRENNSVPVAFGYRLTSRGELARRRE